ncbi:MAG: 2-amino-4-hydroxy-6-hydroxymethyldihydropteridine diphosphokinase [Saprospiraceae bacterium]|nr:2-amino-4-hydroxy-6-hydroxymethyldihydropteridine diphosphokinase [Saprospiraceae bacterium]MCB9318516.1 2-amino-4-hydroxy-6-hydroxymethyldihydropteridine diphosphokinase [Lewinellaceae bacterium]
MTPLPPPHQVILSLGGNVGQVLDTFTKSRERLIRQVGPIINASRLYFTEPWGEPDQPHFYNQLLMLETGLSPLQVLHECQQIEIHFDRTRTVHWGPRTLDIDILFYDHLVLDTEELIIPHPRIHERNFILVPLMEIVSDWVHPVYDLSIEELYNQCEDFNEVMIAEEE